MKIENIMTKNPLSIEDSSSASAVISLMGKHNIDHIPVIDHNENLCGIISKSDLYKRVLTLIKSSSGATYVDKILNTTSAREIMTPTFVTVTPNQSMEYAIEILLQGKFHAILVSENAKLVGIITAKDLLTFISDSEVLLKKLQPINSKN